jgi:hypothetical protein
MRREQAPAGFRPPLWRAKSSFWLVGYEIAVRARRAISVARRRVGL